MAKLTRKTQKILGNTGGANSIAAFGTAQNILSGGSPTYTSDVAEIQNANFETGWGSAIPDNYNPFREDFNAVGNVATRQLAYLYETGTPEYDPGTNYCLGADCKYMLGNGNYQIFQSLKNDNKGNSLSDNTSWLPVYDTVAGIARRDLLNTPMGNQGILMAGVYSYMARLENNQVVILYYADSLHTVLKRYVLFGYAGEGKASSGVISFPYPFPTGYYVLSSVNDDYDSGEPTVQFWNATATTINWALTRNQSSKPKFSFWYKVECMLP